MNLNGDMLSYENNRSKIHFMSFMINVADLFNNFVICTSPKFSTSLLALFFGYLNSIFSWTYFGREVSSKVKFRFRNLIFIPSCSFNVFFLSFVVAWIVLLLPQRNQTEFCFQNLDLPALQTQQHQCYCRKCLNKILLICLCKNQAGSHSNIIL